jgi:hypothetical protein
MVGRAGEADVLEDVRQRGDRDLEGRIVLIRRELDFDDGFNGLASTIGSETIVNRGLLPSASSAGAVGGRFRAQPNSRTEVPVGRAPSPRNSLRILRSKPSILHLSRNSASQPLTSTTTQRSPAHALQVSDVGDGVENLGKISHGVRERDSMMSGSTNYPIVPGKWGEPSLHGPKQFLGGAWLPDGILARFRQALSSLSITVCAPVSKREPMQSKHLNLRPPTHASSGLAGRSSRVCHQAQRRW